MQLVTTTATEQKKTVIFNRPHGADFVLNDGTEIYLQKGKQCMGFHEGQYISDLMCMIERDMADKLPDVDDYYLFNQPTETPTGARTKAVNMIADAIGGECLTIELHVNAFGNGAKYDKRKNSAEGHRVFYNAKGKKYAQAMSEAIMANKLTNTIERPIKKAPPWWRWVHNNKGPMLLVELFFMTNEKETKAANCQAGMQGFSHGVIDFCWRGWR